jgi:hypothetical protein
MKKITVKKGLGYHSSGKYLPAKLEVLGSHTILSIMPPIRNSISILFRGLFGVAVTFFYRKFLPHRILVTGHQYAHNTWLHMQSS